MIITIAILTLDWIVLHLNGQNLLKYHSLYIAFLVIKLWFHQQPKTYQISSQTINQLKAAKVQIPEETISNICQICNSIKASRYYHCRRCRKCIYRMDHHCSWVGNCIGQYNSKVYLHLLANIFLHCLSLVFAAIASYSYLFNVQRYQIYYFVNIFPAIYAVFQSHRLTADFWLSLKRNQTLIQSYKKVVGKKISVQENLRSYLGDNKLGWFIPYFESNKNCDLLQRTFNESKEQVKEYVYADEYMDGLDEQCDEILLKQE